MADWKKTYSERPDWIAQADPEDPLFEDIKVDSPPLAKAASRKRMDELDRRAGGLVKSLCIGAMSCIFISFFTYATIMEIQERKETERRLDHEIFYGMSAGLPLLFLIHWMVCFPVTLLYLLGTGMTVWGSAMMVFICLDFKDLEDDSEQKSDMIYEIAAIAASIYSSIYHLCFMKCFIGKKEKTTNNDDT